MSNEFREHLTRDQRPFLHTESGARPEMFKWVGKAGTYFEQGGGLRNKTGGGWSRE